MAATFEPGQTAYYLTRQGPVLVGVKRVTSTRVVITFWKNGVRDRAVLADNLMTVEMYQYIQQSKKGA